MSALVFDCDGVLADTERFGHLPAFNQTFEEFGLPVRWSEEEYGRRLEIGGGKERMASLLTEDFVGEAGLPADPDGQRAQVAAWHQRKTAIYKAMVAGGRLPARPGVARVIADALEAGWPVAVASTSAEESVRAVVEHVVTPGPGGQDRRLRRRRGPGQEARPGHLPARGRGPGAGPRRHAGGRGLPQRPAGRGSGPDCAA